MADELKDLIHRRHRISDEILNEKERIEKVTKPPEPKTYEVVNPRSPSDGLTTIKSGDNIIKGKNVTNSVLNKGQVIQHIGDTNSGALPSVNKTPHFLPPPDPPNPGSHTPIGQTAVLMDYLTEVSTEPDSSCNPEKDFFGLFVSVRYLKQAVTTILFSFPVDNGSPFDYTCTRYNFERPFGCVGSCEYECVPSTDPDATYATYSECRNANPVTCEDDPYGSYPGQPLASRVLSCSEGAWTLNDYLLFDIENAYDQGEKIDIGTTDGVYGIYWYQGNVQADGSRIDDTPLENVWKTISIDVARTYLTNGPYECGDTETVSYWLAKIYVPPRCSDPDGIGGSSLVGDYVFGGVERVTETWSLQQIGGYLQWIPVTASRGCGNYSGVHYTLPPPQPPPLPDDPVCYPVEGDPSQFKRVFYVGGHTKTPVKVPIEISDEDPYEAYLSTSATGLKVTIKHGQYKDSNGNYKWCQISEYEQAFDSDDWQETLTQSTELNPTVSGCTDAYGGGDNNVIYADQNKVYKINRTQLVTTLFDSVGQRALKDELTFITPPGWSDAAKQISATIQVANLTDEASCSTGTFSNVSTSIWRIAYRSIIDEIVEETYPYGVFQIEAFSPRFIS